MIAASSSSFATRRSSAAVKVIWSRPEAKALACDAPDSATRKRQSRPARAGRRAARRGRHAPPRGGASPAPPPGCAVSAAGAAPPRSRAMPRRWRRGPPPAGSAGRRSRRAAGGAAAGRPGRGGAWREPSLFRSGTGSGCGEGRLAPLSRPCSAAPSAAPCRARRRRPGRSATPPGARRVVRRAGLRGERQLRPQGAPRWCRCAEAPRAVRTQERRGTDLRRDRRAGRDDAHHGLPAARAGGQDAATAAPVSASALPGCGPPSRPSSTAWQATSVCGVPRAAISAGRSASAAVVGQRAARVEGAAGRRADRARHLAADRDALAARSSRGPGSPPSARACRGGAASVNSVSAGASSTSRPRYITPTRSLTCRTTARLWLMNR